MVSAQCSPIAPFTRSRFRVEIRDHAEYQEDQPKQCAEHDQCAHARIPFAQNVLADTSPPEFNSETAVSSITARVIAGRGSNFRDKLANLLAGNVEENRQRGRRSEHLPADMRIAGITVETEVVEAIEQQVHRDTHFHASQVHSQADVRSVAP